MKAAAKQPKEKLPECISCVSDAMNILEDFDLDKSELELIDRLNEATLYLEKAKFLLAQQMAHAA